MMMHNVTMMQKIKEQAILIRGFFWIVTIDTSNKGSCPEIHVKAGEGLARLSNLLVPC
jgi:hypothetical protein